MATTKYKYDKVRSARHIMRDSLALGIKFTDRSIWPDEASQAFTKEIHDALCSAQTSLRGEKGLPREAQVERLSDAREQVQFSLKAATKLTKTACTPQQIAYVTDLKDVLTLAKEHATSAISYAKNRRFESSKAEYEATQAVSLAKETMDEELESILEDEQL